jgi:hypothetical protein
MEQVYFTMPGNGSQAKNSQKGKFLGKTGKTFHVSLPLLD